MHNKREILGILLGLVFSIGSVSGADGTTKPGAQATREMEARRSPIHYDSRGPDSRSPDFEIINRSLSGNDVIPQPHAQGTTTTTQDAQNQTSRAPIRASFRTQTESTLEISEPVKHKSDEKRSAERAAEQIQRSNDPADSNQGD